MGVGGVRHQAERGDDGERHQRSGCAPVSYNLSLIASRKSRRINVKRSKSFLFQPNGRAYRASSSALRHIHCGPTAHGRQSMGGLGQQQDPPMTKLRRHCGTVYQGLASVCGSVAIHGVAGGGRSIATRRQLQGRGDGGRRRRLYLTRMRFAFNEIWDF
jgi:hypothetical protein